MRNTIMHKLLAIQITSVMVISARPALHFHHGRERQSMKSYVYILDSMGNLSFAVRQNVLRSTSADELSQSRTFVLPLPCRCSRL